MQIQSHIMLLEKMMFSEYASAILHHVAEHNHSQFHHIYTRSQRHQYLLYDQAWMETQYSLQSALH